MENYLIDAAWFFTGVTIGLIIGWCRWGKNTGKVEFKLEGSDLKLMAEGDDIHPTNPPTRPPQG
jgi:hypothetical protein